MMTVPRADVVIVILLRALDYPASTGHASGRESVRSSVRRPARRSEAFSPRRAGQPRSVPHDTGSGWALAALVAGAAASALVIELGRTPAAQDAASEPDPDAVDEVVSREEFTTQASR